MKQVNLRGLKIGEGIPKICVPIVGKTDLEIREALADIVSLPSLPDLVEFRADWYEPILDQEKTKARLMEIRNTLKEMPILFTFRTAKEGGEKEITLSQYKEVLLSTAKSGFVDAVDVEAFSFEQSMEELVSQLHNEQVVVIGSNHDFTKTPETQEIVSRLYQMRDWQMDIAKIAVMPKNTEDVYRLLGATYQVYADEQMCPVITMSMSGQGVISRLSGEVFGSAVTFACAGRASAPGQIAMDKLRTVLEVIHESQ